ncbi:MAG TPA: phosphoribosylformylglycinamidine synthase subunit PurQ [Nitrososphaeraceae archaeon]|nr:phosphoribosylformylglycinamidine synthase subunit PurQ [Nitrososphaeraceae archaeon]
MRTGIVVFPGSNCDRDVHHVLNDVMGIKAQYIWHTKESIDNYDALILPGGFSYGDRLRAGVIAAQSPIVEAIKKKAQEGLPILGICNGFQILVEAGLLPGALVKNVKLKFSCKWLKMEVLNVNTPFTNMFRLNDEIQIPIAHGEGRFVIGDDTLEELKQNNQIVFKYKDQNPNGSTEMIAAICSKEGNVMGLMPHPERASEPILSPNQTNSNAGLIFRSLKKFLSSHIKN